MDVISLFNILCLLCVLLVQAVVGRVTCRPPYNTFWCKLSEAEIEYEQREKVCGFSQAPKLIGSLGVGRPVYGVQPIGQEIYVIRDSTPYIEVYDRSTLKPKRSIRVQGMQGPYDMVQSRYIPGSLFIADWSMAKDLIYVLVPEGNVSTWSFKEDNLTTLGLAGSNPYTDGNILVTASVSQKVKKFGVQGNLVDELTIQNISSPRQSIQVDFDRYAVCHGYGPPPAQHRVCLVNGNGTTLRCYGSTQGSGIGRLNIPGRLELSKEDNCILVADTGNKRIVLLNEELKFVKNLINTGLNGPYRLYLDRQYNRLYVADNMINSSGIAVSGRVHIYQV